LPPLESQADLLRRIAEALERAVPAAPAKPDFEAAEAFIWRADSGALAPVARTASSTVLKMGTLPSKV